MPWKEQLIQPIQETGPLELPECALWTEGPSRLSENAETGREEFNNGQLPQECLEEMAAGDKEKWKSETSSSLLVRAETIGIAKVIYDM